MYFGTQPRPDIIENDSFEFNDQPIERVNTFKVSGGNIRWKTSFRCPCWIPLQENLFKTENIREDQVLYWDIHSTIPI